MTRRGPEDEPKGTYDDTNHEDFVDSYHYKEKDTTYYDDYEDYGN
jgi:hypothetical protein